MSNCEAELCHYWTGQGCACEFLGLNPVVTCGKCRTTLRVDGTCPGCNPVLIEFDPESFGPLRHGVRLYSHEEDWGWTAHGHHEPRRIVAACIAEARDAGVLADLRETFDSVDDIAAGIQRKWANNFREPLSEYGVAWDWCDEDAPGAVPMTVVIP